MADEASDFADIYNYAPYVAAGGLIFLSGVVASDAAGSGAAEHFKSVFEALDGVLASAGRSKADIVELTTFHTNYPDHMQAFMQAKNAYLGELKTAWTAVGVAALGAPQTLVEVRAVARA
jgi:enamine deaminase RidA (YjgF/YER057c/UK114 family)